MVHFGKPHHYMCRICTYMHSMTSIDFCHISTTLTVRSYSQPNCLYYMHVHACMYLVMNKILFKQICTCSFTVESFCFVFGCYSKVNRKAMIRNLYNEFPHPTLKAKRERTDTRPSQGGATVLSSLSCSF